MTTSTATPKGGARDMPTCPRCGADELTIEFRLEAAERGTYSLAGVQEKFAASTWPYIVCGGCGIEARGKRDITDGPAR